MLEPRCSSVALSKADRVLRILVTRALLMALPFALYFGWRALAPGSAKDRPAPLGWLFAVGAVLVGLSLMATVAFRPDNRAQTYVPAQAHPGGAVTPGGFEDSPAESTTAGR